MTIELLKAFLVGVIAAVPVGPVLLMVLQKTLCRGKAAGIMTGLGSAVADMIYAAVGLFTLSLIGEFINDYQEVIMLCGGVILALIGVNIFFKEVNLLKEDVPEGLGLWSCAFQSAGSALSNPAALALMLALLASFGLAAEDGRQAPAVFVTIAVFAGEWLYWILLVSLLSMKVRLNEKFMKIVTKVAGAGIMCFAVALVVRAIILFVR